MKIKAVEYLGEKEKENQSYKTPLASKKKKKGCTKAFSIRAVGFVP